jgi:hypothetical protein
MEGGMGAAAAAAEAGRASARRGRHAIVRRLVRRCAATARRKGLRNRRGRGLVKTDSES